MNGQKCESDMVLWKPVRSLLWLEEIYEQKIESLEELKKSVLSKAFSGEL